MSTACKACKGNSVQQPNCKVKESCNTACTAHSGKTAPHHSMQGVIEATLFKLFKLWCSLATTWACLQQHHRCITGTGTFCGLVIARTACMGRADWSTACKAHRSKTMWQHSMQSIQGHTVLHHNTHSMQGKSRTSNQEGGAVGSKLIPEGGEEVDELESLDAGGAASERAIDACWQQEQHKASQETCCLQTTHQNESRCGSEVSFSSVVGQSLPRGRGAYR